MLRRIASGVDMPAPKNGQSAAEAAPSAAKSDELVSKHSYSSGQTPPNPDSTRHYEQPGQNANTFAAPEKKEQGEPPKTPQPLPELFTGQSRTEWETDDDPRVRPEAATAYKRYFAPKEPESPQEPEEPQEEQNALGCSDAADAPDGGQGIGPVEMDWIFALCNGLPVPQDKRQAIARAIHNILDTQIHQTIIESINGSDERIAKFLNEAERETSSNSNTNTAHS